MAGGGFTSARRMHEASWQQRVAALGRGGYVRYDESTATYLGETAALLLARYDGDLDGLREAAGHDPEREADLLRECKGIGRVSAAVFLREIQTVWPEVRPFADHAGELEALRTGAALPPSPTQLATASKQRLLELARDHDVRGRSRMRRDELAAALAELR